MKCSRKHIVLALWVLSFAVYSQAAPQSRFNRPIEQTNVRELTGNIHPFARAQFDRGRASSAMQLGRLAIVFKPSAAQQQALQTLLQQQQDPASANYHKWLTPEQFRARFGMSKDDLAKVSAWLHAQGLTVLGISRSGNEIYFTGTAGQVEYALHTELHNYVVNGETHFANAVNPSLPAAFVDAVVGIKGLNDFHPRPRNVKMRQFTASSNFTSNSSGNHFVTPADFATIYDAGALYSAGFDGTGQTIAVVGQTVIHPADIDAFRSAAGLPTKNFQQILANGTAGVRSSGDEVEADLDVELAGGIAKNAAIIYVYTGNGSNNGAWDALQYIIDNNVAPVVSTSYGLCEAGNGTAFAQMVQGWAQQANTQGQTIVAASGDQGAADCETSGSTSATTGLAVDVPASIPEVTGVGGTEFSGDAGAAVTGSVAAPTQFWGGASDGSGGGTGGGSALSYIPEKTWNDTASDNQLSATGGGVSTIFAKPSWQTGAGVPNDSKRDVPDIALNASPDHDGYLICSQAFFNSQSSTATSCSNGFRASDQSLAVVGGTSTGAPSFAAILALLNQATASTGQGNINPTLYSLAASAPAAFHDVTSGNNKVPCTAGSTGCSAGGGTIGFGAGGGYDEVTGLGTVDAFQLVQAWPSSSLNRTPSSISLTTSNTTINSGDSVTFTATVTPAAPAPTGTVQFLVDGTNTGNPVTLANGQASFTTSGLAAGTRAITASYSGDSNYQASTSSSLTETVNAVNFSLTATPVSSQLAPGSSATSTITATSGNGYSGTINFTCVVSSSTAQIGCSLSPTSSTINASNTTGTTTLTITTTGPHVLTGMMASSAQSPRGWFAITAGALFAGVFLLGIPAKRSAGTLLCLMLFAIILAAPGCGGGSSAPPGSSNAPSGGTPAGSYTVTVTGNDGNNVQQTSVAFTVN